jgi:hypothetical protein
MYTPTEVRALTPIRENVEKQASLDLRGMTGKELPRNCTIYWSRVA